MPPSTEQARWFSEHVQPHEPALRAYLSKRFPEMPDHDDLIQEAYLRALRAHEADRVPCARAFLFVTVRNAAIDLFRRRRSRLHVPVSEFAEMPTLAETPTTGESMEHEQRREILLEAIMALPERCRQVMVLRHVEGRAYKDIAANLGISAETVKVHLIKGVKDCTRFFHQRGLLGRSESGFRLTA